MKIQKIILNNIGPYIGENTITFNTTNSTKNIILIGGRNGAGKTTLFDSMKLCLYGYKLYGYRQNSQTYTSKIKRIINDGAKKTSSPKAGIALSIFIEDGYSNSIFTISRNWSLQKSHFKEVYNVYKDDILLSDEEKVDFDNYLLQTIPLALFNFHFFNGENISEFLFNKENGLSFRKAFMQICGLDTLDLIQEQLQNNIQTHSKDSDSTIQDDYFEKKSQHKLLQENLSNIDIELKKVEQKIISLEDESNLLEQEMTRYGGVQSQEWQLIQEQIRIEESLREETHKYLKDTANNVLPFLILKKELAELQQQIQIEFAIASNRIIQERLQNKNTRGILNNNLMPYLKSSSIKLEDDFFQMLYNAVKNDCPESSSEFLKLSEHEQLSILSKVNKCLSFDEDEIINAEKRIKKSLAKTKYLRSNANSKEILSSENYLCKKNELLSQIDELRKELLDLTHKKTKASDEFTKLTQAFDKASVKFKAILKERSVNDISARSMLAFEELRKNLYKKYISKVEDMFICNFNALLSKDDLLDGIYITDNFEVIPYKYSSMKTSNIHALIDQHGEEYVKEQLGVRAFNLFFLNATQNKTIELPVKIDQHFSAGEQQIYVMALYQALSDIRSAELPFVIDTPLARIDRLHRKNILNSFFSKLPGQVIILSTDEEIDTSSLKLLQEKLADLYLIEHQTDGTIKILHQQYFEEVSQ